jgi:hypothetical protein
MSYRGKKILVSCPLCKAKKLIEVPQSVLEGKKQLKTISIPKGKICDHHFQIFVDKHYIIRGYQKVDYELSEGQNSGKLLSESLKIDKNRSKGNIAEKPKKRKNMSLKDIYDEFWEYISIDNEEFKIFITKDIRRKENLSKIRYQQAHT